MPKYDKSVIELIERLCNNNLESDTLSNFTEVNAALVLSGDYPDIFECHNLGYDKSVKRTVRRFVIKKLGLMPDFIKNNSKYYGGVKL